jgi:hypothetical protein
MDQQDNVSPYARVDKYYFAYYLSFGVDCGADNDPGGVGMASLVMASNYPWVWFAYPHSSDTPGSIMADTPL